MSDVFISYSRKNSDFARKLIDRLTLANKDSWVDWEGIPLSAPNWWAEIKAGIESADNFIFIMTPDSMASIVCNMELDYAFELGKRVIPIVHETVAQQEAFATIADYQPDESMTDRLSGKQPLDIANHNWQELSHINWTFFREDDDFDDAFQTLLQTVETDLEYVKAHTRYLTRAQEWQRNQQRDDLLLFGEEIDYAEQWLLKGDAYVSQQSDERDIVNPLPRALHRDYILASRQADRQRKRLARSAQLSIAVLALAVIGGGIFAFFALNALNTQIDDANNQLSTATQVLFDVQTDVADSDNQLATATQALQLVSTTVADANTQLSAVPPTLTEVNGQIALAEEQVNQASTQVAQSNQQLATATQALVTATYVAELEAQAQVTLAVANTQVVDALVTVTQASIERQITTNFANAILQNVNSPAEQLRLMDEIVAD
ncbi:MAG: TIR domain-containing protein, partial [Chloroflexota bacterium]